jgi:hypothetical protein
MRVSTWAQNSTTDVSGDGFSTNGTTPATIPGRVFDSGATRLPTGKSRTTSRSAPHQPRTIRAQAAVIIVVRGTSHARQSCSTLETTPGSTRIGPVEAAESLSPVRSGK